MDIIVVNVYFKGIGKSVAMNIRSVVHDTFCLKSSTFHISEYWIQLLVRSAHLSTFLFLHSFHLVLIFYVINFILVGWQLYTCKGAFSL